MDLSTRSESEQYPTILMNVLSPNPLHVLEYVNKLVLLLLLLLLLLVTGIKYLYCTPHPVMFLLNYSRRLGPANTRKENERKEYFCPYIHIYFDTYPFENSFSKRRFVYFVSLRVFFLLVLVCDYGSGETERGICLCFLLTYFICRSAQYRVMVRQEVLRVPDSLLVGINYNKPENDCDPRDYQVCTILCMLILNQVVWFR